MFPGPVFAVELLTTAKRSRYYALRTLYGMLLLLIIWVGYREFLDSHGEGQVLFAPGDMSQFAGRTFTYFAIAQGIIVLAITPALVAGTIAGEKQRKTLHYLLASELTSYEIVLGKWLARMLMNLVYMLAGIPVLFILRFFGGIQAWLILLAFLTTLSTMIALASMSIFFSTIMRQAKSAIVATYLSMLVIALLPPIIGGISSLYGDNLSWIVSIIDWCSPVPNREEIDRWVMGGVGGLSLIRVFVAQAIYSTLFLTYSTLRLRDIAANQTSRSKVILRLDRRGRPSWRALPRPSISSDPMMWKERYTSRIGGWAKMLGLLNNLFWATLIGCFTFDYARTAIWEIIQGKAGGSFQNRHDFLSVIQGISACVAAFWILGTATTAAASIASEREDDTWLSLIATDLEGREILRAKMIGSIMRFRWLGLMLLIVWLIGVLAGAVHPLSFLIASGELLVFLGFAAALGIRFSLPSSSTSRALAMTLAILVFMNGGYLLTCMPLASLQMTAAFAGLMPWLLYHSLFSSETLHAYESFIQSSYSANYRAWENWAVIPSLIGIAIYVSLTLYLAWRSFRMFDRIVDRPRINS